MMCDYDEDRDKSHQQNVLQRQTRKTIGIILPMDISIFRTISKQKKESMVQFDHFR